MEELIEKYQDIWQDVYQEYNYAFNSYEEFLTKVKSFLIKYKKDFSNDNKEREYYLNGIKKYLPNTIRHQLNNNKIDILLNYITSNINPNNNENKEIAKLIDWFKTISYTPAPNVIIDLIEQSPIFNELIKRLVENNFTKIKQYGLEKVFDNDLIVLFSEIYCTLNDIVLDEDKNIEYSEEDITIYEEDKDEKNKAYSLGEKEMPDFILTDEDAFISEIKRKDLAVLTKEEECELLTRIKNGDQKAYDYFYEHNCRLVISIAKRYRHLKVEYADILQEGCIGLMTAIEHFEVEKGFKFSTYATWWIKQAILRAINKYGKKTGVSISKNSDLVQYRKKVNALADELGRTPTDEEIAKHLDLSLDEIQENNRLLLNDYSINQKVNADEVEEIGDFIKDENIKVENESIINNLADEIQNLFKKAGLTNQEILILNHRWGLKYTEEKTLSDIGKLFGFTRERARQCEAKAIKKLRKYAGTKDFAYYLDNPDKALENLKKLAAWHFSNPNSYIIYDIDLNNVSLDMKKRDKELSWDTKKKKKYNHLYQVFKRYKISDIDAVLETLSEEEKKILDIRNDYFNNPTLYSSWNMDDVQRIYKNIIAKMNYLLSNYDKKGKPSTIYDLDFCSGYSKEEIALAINMLDYQDKEIINMRYGNDLDNPVISKEWDFKKYGDIFYEEVIPHIINNLKTIKMQNKEIEDKIVSLSENEEIDINLKEMYIKALQLLKLPEIKIILQGFSFKEALVFTLYLLRYFEGIEFNIEDFMDIIVINKEGLNECVKKSLLFMKEHLDEFNLLKDKLYYSEEDEKKLSRN